jgi:AAA15 family ATPase/GTPase
MVIEFSVGNFLSFAEKKTLSFESKGISELKNNVVTFQKHKLLRSAVVYGANSSGKSNLIKAFGRMREMVLLSVKLNDSDKLDYSPFLLNMQKEAQATHFEVIFNDGNQIYRYGFEYTLTHITKEWLFIGKPEKPMFIRTMDGIGVLDSFKEGKGKESATNDNRLFVSLVAQLGGIISKKILDLFRNYNVVSGIDHNDYKDFTALMFDEQLKGYEDSKALYQNLKLGFKNILAKRVIVNQAISESASVGFKIDLYTVHSKYDNNGKMIGEVVFDRGKIESDGTNKLIDISGPIFDTLINGKLLIVDELDAKLHPLISFYIVSLFNSPDTNPNNAQLFFATHDTNLLSTELFRRDQIWFTEKDAFEQSDLYSLYDFVLPDGTKVRNDANIEKNYIRGRYGAIPFITN